MSGLLAAPAKSGRVLMLRPLTTRPDSSAPGLDLADEGPTAAFRRAPLMLKVAGASAPLLAAVLLVTWWNYRAIGLPRYALGLVLVVLLATVLAHVALVAFALQPLTRLVKAVEAFGAGDSTVDVAPSPWSDRDLARLEITVSGLFDAVRRDRERHRQLAERVLRTADVEQTRIARELFDSTAQSMAALLFELRAASTKVTDPSLHARLDGIRQIASGVLDEVKELSQQVHPGWTSNQGLQGALMHLVREHNANIEAQLTVDAAADVDALDTTAAGLVYRTAQAALRRAVLDRCQGLHLGVRLDPSVGCVVLEVTADHVRGATLSSAAESIDALRERAELLGGSLELQVEGDHRRLLLQLPVRLATGPGAAQPPGGS